MTRDENEAADAINDRSSTPLLHLGWLKKEDHKEDDADPLMLKFGDLCYHAAVLAGSGAGKSTVVGRIIEEILIKTKGRVVIVDTNGDFRQSHIVLEKGDTAWKKRNQEIDTRFWDRDEFEMRWRTISRIQFAPPSNSSEHAEWIFPPLINWGELPIDWQMDILGLDIGRHHDEIAALYEIQDFVAGEAEPVSPQSLMLHLDFLSRTSKVTEAQSALRARLNQRKSDIWKQKESELDLRSSFAAKIEQRPQLSIFDVPSIIDVTTRDILLSFLLKTIWKVALLDWEEASEGSSDKDQRTPTFIVIDEAHNFVPAEDPADPHALRISQSIQRIAAEGRKYGLFLILATQRPSKVRPGLLSECENLCLLRLRSPIERGLAVDTWALRDDNRHPRLSPLAKYNPGEGLLFGHWTGWNEIPFKTGRRRTKPTGGNLQDTWIPKVKFDPLDDTTG
jgi:uncharacterized protein